ncbi:MAG: 16S rRNA (adenine(1518)-N(6)/adenine(1519)-N(6))-dimethyltransferase RsmA [Erysipelotrichaceae bacterium]|nr:16S rRNA (adenine(1518)-N(6)/adenine(1519)-N(6))-dimethyltransferase RsmA [Erysipelotrichaceae bacterium]
MKDIATVATTDYILNKYNLKALKKFGQNFLIDSNVVTKIVHSQHIDHNTCVIEIGPGIGAMTQILQRFAGQVISYEIDTRFEPVYREFLDYPNVEIIFGDFLEVDIATKVDELKKEYEQVLVVANIPYYITTRIIEKIILSGAKVDAMLLMVQKEVALKFSGDYKSPLTLLIDYLGKSEYLFTVSKNVFNPRPHIDSAILRITISREYDKKLYELLEVAFRQRRKTIFNNLKEEYGDARHYLEEAGIKENMRCDQLDISDYLNLLKVIGEKQ